MDPSYIYEYNEGPNLYYKLDPSYIYEYNEGPNLYYKLDPSYIYEYNEGPNRNQTDSNVFQTRRTNHYTMKPVIIKIITDYEKSALGSNCNFISCVTNR